MCRVELLLPSHSVINTATPSLCLRLRVGNQLFRAQRHGAERTAPLPQVGHQQTAGHAERLRNRSELLVRHGYKWCPCSVLFNCSFRLNTPDPSEFVRISSPRREVQTVQGEVRVEG